MGHLVTQFQGQILRDAPNIRARGHASVCGYDPPFPYIIGQEVYYSIGRFFYYIIEHLLHYRAFLLHYRALITVSGVYYIIGWYRRPGCNFFIISFHTLWFSLDFIHINLHQVNMQEFKTCSDIMLPTSIIIN